MIRGVIMFQVEFYESKDGRQPVVEFLDSLDPKGFSTFSILERELLLQMAL